MCVLRSLAWHGVSRKRTMSGKAKICLADELQINVQNRLLVNYDCEYVGSSDGVGIRARPDKDSIGTGLL
jgi:hypothetical protein